METIEERATKYACDGCMPDGIECDSCYNIHGKCERDAYIAGAKASGEMIPDCIGFARNAVELADALIEELEKK